MHMSDPSRDKVSKGSTASGSLSSEASRTDDCNCYCEVGPQGVLPRRCRLECAPVVRVDSTATQLTGFLGDQLASIQSGSLSFGGMWMAPLSWHVARLSSPPDPGPTRLASPNQIRCAILYILYIGTLIDLFFLRAVPVPISAQTISIITKSFVHIQKNYHRSGVHHNLYTYTESHYLYNYLYMYIFNSV